MTMHLYALVEDGGSIVETLSPVWGASKLKFTGSWHEARGDCIRHAIKHGHKAICIVAHNVELYCRQHGGPVHRANKYDLHGLWLYLDRLLCRYGHAYVPPLAWAKLKDHPYFLTPTIPSVAAYQVSALETLDNVDSIALGQDLCANGYDSFNVNDYYHLNLGYSGLDDLGSAASWRKQYERAIARLIGPSH